MITRCPNPECGRYYRLPDAKAGRKAKCKHCGRTFTVSPAEPPPAKKSKPKPAQKAAPPSKRKPKPKPAELEQPPADENLTPEPRRRPPPQAPPAAADDEYELKPQAPTPPPPRPAKWPLVLASILLLTTAAFAYLWYEARRDFQQATAEKAELLRNAARKAASSKPEPARLDDRPAFRDVAWGATAEQIAQAEGRPPDARENGTLGYEGLLLGRKVYIYYVLADGRLVRAGYTLAEKYNDPAEYIKLYRGVKSLYTQRYGPPVQDEAVALNDAEADQQKARALADGRLAYFSRFETDQSAILVSLAAQERQNLVFTIEFKSRKLAFLESGRGPGGRKDANPPEK